MKLTAPVCSTFDLMIFLTLLRESISFAFHALRVNRLRTLLSLLGITIGIFAIIAVFTAVDSMEYKVRSSVQSLGENVIYIEKWPWAPEDGVEYEWWEYMNRPVAQVSEAEELAKRLTLSEAVVFTARLRKTVNYKTSFVENAQVQAAMYPYDRVKTFNISTGRYFTEQETEAGKAVCIIGDNVRKALFNLEDPLGKDIKVFGLKVTVVGVFDPADMGEEGFALAPAFGIHHADLGALSHQRGDDGEGGGVAHVVGVGLEGDAEDADRLAVHRAVEEVHDLVQHARLDLIVDLDHGFHDLHGNGVFLADAGQCLGILGET